MPFNKTLPEPDTPSLVALTVTVALFRLMSVDDTEHDTFPLLSVVPDVGLTAPGLVTLILTEALGTAWTAPLK